MKKAAGDKYVYYETDLLGQGNFSRVYLGKHGVTKKKVAIKIMELAKIEGKMKHLLQEIEIMHHLNHKNIVQLYDVVHERFGNSGVRLYIIMEYCEKGDITSISKPLHEEKCRKYFRGIFSGLRYLKKRGIVHRDIKPANILLTKDDEVKLADFTFAKQIQEEEMLQTMCGTPLYMSPEVLYGEGYSDKCDLWSVGIMMYQFLYSHHPFGNVRTQVELMSKMKTVKISFPKKLVTEHYETDPDSKEPILCRTIHHFSDAGISLLKGLLKHSPQERVNWEEIYVDPWLKLEPFNGENELFPFHEKVSVTAHSAPVEVIPHFPPPRSIKATKAYTLSRPKLIPIAKVGDEKKQQITSSPMSSTESQTLPFQMSEENSTTPNENAASRIIMDYYSGSSVITTTTTVAKQKQHQQPTNYGGGGGSFVSKSIDMVQRLFYSASSDK